MSEGKARLVIDITELKNWSGHLTGVQRVVFGLANEIRKIDPGTAFCSFDEAHGIFVEEDFNNYLQAMVGTKTPQTSTISSRDRVRAVALKTYFAMPISIRQKMSPDTRARLKQKAKTAYRLSQKGISGVRKITRKAEAGLPVAAPDQMALGPADVLIMPGRLWDYPDCIDYIIKNKVEQRFKLAVVLYDLVPIFQRHTFGPGLTERYAPYLFQSIYYADYLLPISKSTKKDTILFAEELGLKLPGIQVIRLGDDLPENELRQPTLPVSLDNGFGLCVGTIEARKNHSLIYYAYKLAAQEKIDLPPLIIIGKGGWLTGDITYFIKNDADVKDKLVVVDNVSDAELGWLYKHALFSAYPSQYEGWGLPIAESMVYGTPCIASNTSSMTEISNLVDIVSPFDSRTLMEKIKYYSVQQNSLSKREQISRQYKPYSWAKTARHLYDFIASSN